MADSDSKISGSGSGSEASSEIDIVFDRTFKPEEISRLENLATNKSISSNQTNLSLGPQSSNSTQVHSPPQTQIQNQTLSTRTFSLSSAALSDLSASFPPVVRAPPTLNLPATDAQTGEQLDPLRQLHLQSAQQAAQLAPAFNRKKYGSERFGQATPKEQPRSRNRFISEALGEPAIVSHPSFERLNQLYPAIAAHKRENQEFGENLRRTGFDLERDRSHSASRSASSSSLLSSTPPRRPSNPTPLHSSLPPTEDVDSPTPADSIRMSSSHSPIFRSMRDKKPSALATTRHHQPGEERLLHTEPLTLQRRISSETQIHVVTDFSLSTSATRALENTENWSGVGKEGPTAQANELNPGKGKPSSAHTVPSYTMETLSSYIRHPLPSSATAPTPARDIGAKKSPAPSTSASISVSVASNASSTYAQVHAQSPRASSKVLNSALSSHPSSQARK